MTSLSEIDMSFEECLSTAKARLVMVAFVNFHDPSNEDVMKLMQKISKANKRIVVMAVDASKNMTLAQHFNVTMYPTFIFFRNRVVLGSRITMNQAKLLKDIEKYNKATNMYPIFDINMGLDECLISAKARLVMVAFVDLQDEDTADIMRILQDINHENKRLVILIVNARNNLNLAQRFGITFLPTFLYFRSCQQLGSRVTTKEVKLKKDIAKYSRIYLSSPQL